MTPESKIIEQAMKLWEPHAVLREGFRDRVYLDSLGFPTAGIGHLLTTAEKLKYKVGDKIPQKILDDWFEQDSQTALRTSIRQCIDLGRIKNPDWLMSLISVNFQLGDFSRKFKRSYALLKKNEYWRVINNLQVSLWHRQTPVRVMDFVKAIEKEYR